jgi:hypothetical protein
MTAAYFEELRKTLRSRGGDLDLLKNIDDDSDSADDREVIAMITGEDMESSEDVFFDDNVEIGNNMDGSDEYDEDEDEDEDKDEDKDEDDLSRP